MEKANTDTETRAAIKRAPEYENALKQFANAICKEPIQSYGAFLLDPAGITWSVLETARKETHPCAKAEADEVVAAWRAAVRNAKEYGTWLEGGAWDPDPGMNR
jgi:hypothetical protein